MEYLNYISSGLKVLKDRSYDFINYYMLSDNDIDESLNNNNIPYKKRIFTPKSKIDQIQTFFSDPTHIIDNIYLGSAFNASNYNSLKRLDIGFVINMTNEISNYYENEIKYKKYGLYDNNKQSITDYLELTYNEIIKFQRENPNKNILIHCFMGASRSASILTYYLYKKHNYSVNDAIIYIKNKRDVVNLTVLFYNELCELEYNNKLKNQQITHQFINHKINKNIDKLD
jgi:protein-tyrosine phosphatase